MSDGARPMEMDVYPYQFPTTVVLVDDDAAFLANFSLALDAALSFRLFDSAAAALAYLNRADQPSPLYQRCLSHYRDAVGCSVADQLIRLDVSALAREIGNPDRFGEVSVVIVDYDMPGMDGLELCRRLRHSRIKRLLLTGVGDERVAVKAFNAGLIDRFISKSERNLAEEVNAAVRELQSRYFRDVQRTLRESLNLEAPPFMRDPVFAAYFHGLLREHGYVEYYFTAEPAGFLLLTADGTLGRLLVYTDADLRSQWEIACDQDCPPELAYALSSGSAVPYFWHTEGFYRPECGPDWRSYLYPATPLPGAELYYIALVKRPPLQGHGQVSSYSAYLDWLDRSTAVT